MATMTKSTASTATLSTVSEAQVTTLSKGQYEVVGGDSGGDVQARILCQPAGSDKFYSDTRLADGKLQIDMTKQVQYT